MRLPLFGRISMLWNLSICSLEGMNAQIEVSYSLEIGAGFFQACHLNVTGVGSPIWHC